MVATPGKNKIYVLMVEIRENQEKVFKPWSENTGVYIQVETEEEALVRLQELLEPEYGEIIKDRWGELSMAVEKGSPIYRRIFLQICKTI